MNQHRSLLCVGTLVSTGLCWKCSPCVRPWALLGCVGSGPPALREPGGPRFPPPGGRGQQDLGQRRVVGRASCPQRPFRAGRWLGPCSLAGETEARALQPDRAAVEFGLCLSGSGVWTPPHLRVGGRDTGREGRRVSEIEAASGRGKHMQEVAVWPAPWRGRQWRLTERRTPVGTWWAPSFAPEDGKPERKRPETHI